MIAIIDYGAGNLRSVDNAFRWLGIDAVVTGDPGVVSAADGVVFPGVGAFGETMKALKSRGLDKAIAETIGRGRPFLGICLGLQTLFEMSEESFDEGGENPQGLGIIKGRVRRLPAGPEMGLKVPQIGWNRIRFAGENPLFKGIRDGAYVYFVHSYYVEPSEDGVAACTTDYGIDFVSGIRKGNIHALQFHPEKSGDVGLTILRNFGELVADVSNTGY